MKKEIINCLTWYANRVAETVQYETWSDEYARKELKKSISTIMCGPYEKKTKFLAALATYTPSLYKMIHTVYAQIKGTNKKYEVK